MQYRRRAFCVIDALPVVRDLMTLLLSIFIHYPVPQGVVPAERAVASIRSRGRYR